MQTRRPANPGVWAKGCPGQRLRGGDRPGRAGEGLLLRSLLCTREQSLPTLHVHCLLCRERGRMFTDDQFSSDIFLCASCLFGMVMTVLNEQLLSEAQVVSCAPRQTQDEWKSRRWSLRGHCSQCLACLRGPQKWKQPAAGRGGNWGRCLYPALWGDLTLLIRLNIYTSIIMSIIYK